MPWSGKHGLITRVYLQQFGTVEHAVSFALFVSMVLHATYPSNHFLSATFQQPRVLSPDTAVVRGTFLINTVRPTHSPYRSLTLLPNVAIESN